MVEVDTRSDLDALERFVIDNQELDQLEERLGEFNLFEALGAVRQELRHSDTLRFLLDPAAPHGLGQAFLSAFLKHALAGSTQQGLGAIDIDVTDLSATKVYREWRHLDILLVNDEAGFVFAVENKIDAGEQSGQLAHYRRTVEDEYHTYRRAFLFLTPEGNRPTDEEWIPVNYGMVAESIGSVLAAYQSRIGTDVSALLRHYMTMLRRHIVSDSEIAELCRRIYAKHQQALDLIFEHRPDSQLRIAEVVRGLINSSEREGIVADTLGKTYLHFALREWDVSPGNRLANASDQVAPASLVRDPALPRQVLAVPLRGPRPFLDPAGRLRHLRVCEAAV